jgi:hypothetical protein
MKRQVLLLTLLFLLFSLVVKAQSTYLLPWPGQTHTYSATVPVAGSEVRWYVTTDETGTTKAVHGTDYSFVTSGYDAVDDQLEATGVYEVEITWGTSVAAAKHFYVFIEVDDVTSQCTNRMALDVQINADFNAVVYDVTTASDPATVASTDPSILEESCPDDVENAIYNSTTSSHTDIGYSELVYRIEREFSVLDWQFEYQLSEGSNQTFNLENIRMLNESGSEIYNGTDLTQTVTVGDAENYVLVYVQITNQQGTTLDMDLDLITSNSLTKDSGSNIDSNTTDNNADHTILPMPVISGFGGN